jgi:TolB-like protein
MPDKPRNLEQFWQELKRRRVIHVVTVYASAAFVIIELVGNLADPLNLPEKLQTIIVIVLAVGFPLAVILSWLYDLTSQGMKKTKPLSEIRKGEKPIVPNAWKIATWAGFAMIIGLVTLNIMGGTNKLWAKDTQSLLILPVENVTGDNQLDWFAEGMHASLIHDMGRVTGFNVLNRTSSSVYRNLDKSLQEIASETNRDIVIKPEITCLGDSICFLVEVIRPFPREKTLWIAEYREARNQITNLYNRLTIQIADKVNTDLTETEEQILAETRTVDTAAYAAYTRGLLNLDEIDRVSLQKASKYFTLATRIDPDWAPPYAGLAMVGAYQMQMSFKMPSDARQMIYKNLNRALELDPNSADSHYAKAVIAVWTEWNWEKGEEEFNKSLELNPSNALCRMFYAHLLNILHRSEEAKYQADLTLNLDPHRPFILGLYGALMDQMGNFQSAIVYYEKALSIDPNHRFSIASLQATYRRIGEYDKWFEEWKKLKREWWDDEFIATIQKVLEKQGGLAAIEMIIKGEEEAANEIPINIGGIVRRYLALKNCDAAMDWLEKGYEIHHPGMPYISTWSYDIDQLKQNPRYIKLLKKMNLPLPEE